MKQLFDTPVDASNFSAGLGTAHGVKILSTNYETGTYHFRLTDAEGSVVSNDKVFGASAPSLEETSEASASAHIRAAIAATVA